MTSRIRLHAADVRPMLETIEDQQNEPSLQKAAYAAQRQIEDQMPDNLEALAREPGELGMLNFIMTNEAAAIVHGTLRMWLSDSRT